MRSHLLVKGCSFGQSYVHCFCNFDNYFGFEGKTLVQIAPDPGHILLFLLFLGQFHTLMIVINDRNLHFEMKTVAIYSKSKRYLNIWGYCKIIRT